MTDTIRRDQHGIRVEDLIPVYREGHTFYSADKAHRYDPENPLEGPELLKLAGSIQEYGQKQPITVRRHKTLKGKFETAGGNRRTRAVELLLARGVTTDIDGRELRVWATIKDLTDEQLMETSREENLQRQDDDPITEAEWMNDCRRKLGWDDEKIALRFQKKVGLVRRYIGPAGLLNGTPAVKLAVKTGRLSVGHALQITHMSEGEQDEKLADVLAGGQKQTNSPGERNLTVATRKALLDLLVAVETQHPELLARLGDLKTASYRLVIKRRLCFGLKEADREMYLPDDE